MAYSQNVPQANQRISDTQGPILNNFAGIKTLIDVNHVTFDDPNQGKHKFVTFPVQAAAPACALGEVLLYSRTSATTAVPELVFRKQNNGEIIEFTGRGVGQDGWTRFPSGILIRWGVGQSSPTQLTTSIDISGLGNPQFTTIYNIQLTPIGTSPNLRSINLVGIDNNHTFSVATSVVHMQFHYLITGIG